MAGILPESGGVLTYGGVAAINAFLAQLGIVTQGNVYWVKPRTGSDVANGLTPQTAFQTLAHAQNVVTANQNDVVLLCAEGNSSGNTAGTAWTTDYQSATLTWAKDLVHLIGVNAGPLFSQRSRVAFASGYTGTGDLFTLSANGCLIANIEFFMGVASVNPIGCMLVTGVRNHLKNCMIAGMGNTTNDINNAYSLKLSGAEENFFEDCTIGQNTSTVGTGTTTAVILFAAAANAATRNWFRRCRILMYTSSATNCAFVRAPANSTDRDTVFEDCLFSNAIDSGSTSVTNAFVVAAGGGGFILFGNTALHGFGTGWNSTNSGNVWFATGNTPTAASVGLAVAVTG